MPGANLRKIMSEVPRALEVVARDDKDLVPMGRKPLTPSKAFRKQGEFLARVVDGHRELDDNAADVVRSYLDAYHARYR